MINHWNNNFNSIEKVESKSKISEVSCWKSANKGKLKKIHGKWKYAKVEKRKMNNKISLSECLWLIYNSKFNGIFFLTNKKSAFD